mgnify:CR=1 FL=1
MTIESFVFVVVFVPLGNCLDVCLVCGERIFVCFDADVLLLVVGVVFCETIAAYCRTGSVDVVVVVVVVVG